MANNRLMNQTVSPSKRSRMKYKRKAMRESMEKEDLLATVKKNFTKVNFRKFLLKLRETILVCNFSDCSSFH